MTLDELKTEAGKLGYSVVKKQKRIPHVRCTCGGRGEEWYGRLGCRIKCDRCQKSFGHAKTSSAAWRLWHDGIMAETQKEEVQ